MTADLLLIGFSLLTWGLGEGAFFISSRFTCNSLARIRSRSDSF